MTTPVPPVASVVPLAPVLPVPVIAPVDSTPPAPAPPPPVVAPLITATRQDLEAAGKLDSVIGQQALRLAEKLCSGFDTGSATAAVSKEFRAVMALALENATKKADLLDEVAQRRAQKAASA